jgi:exonuclease III
MAIDKLAKRFDIVFLQETKLLAKENQALKSIASAHEVFYSNNLSNTGSDDRTHTAGVCTIISKKYTSKYVVKVLDLPTSLSGHCLVVHISLPGSDFSIKLINIRLITPSQNKVAAQEQMIKDLHAALVPHATKFTILGGDLNFVENASDTTSDFKAETRPCWESLKKLLNIYDEKTTFMIVIVMLTHSSTSLALLPVVGRRTFGLRVLTVSICLTLKLI